MQSVMNFKITYRESFRPFALSVLPERVADCKSEQKTLEGLNWQREFELNRKGSSAATETLLPTSR